MVFINEESNNFYLITGGQGYFSIQKFIDSNFGIDIISRLINKEEKIIKVVKERSFVGGISGTTKHFRKNYNLFENEDFGKIFQELILSIDNEKLVEYFGFTNEEIRRESVCIAKSSFRINKSINFTQLIKIIDGSEYILKNINPISINNVIKLSKKKDSELIKKLRNILLAQLWATYRNEENSYKFDLCHRNYEKYLTASKYIIKKGNSTKSFLDNFYFGKLNDIDTLFKKISESNIKIDSYSDFEVLIESLNIYSFNEEDMELTRGSIINHIFGDVELEEKRYFYLDSSWFLIKADFVKNLNKKCKGFIERNYFDGLTKAWDISLQNENAYNQQYLGDKKTLVLDKIIPENIEVCDILKWDGNSAYLYHVKKTFGNTMRDLCSQIFISASRIVQDLNSDKVFLRKIYLDLRNKIGGDNYYNAIGQQTNNITEEQFVELFNKKIIYVLSILDTSSKNRNLANIEEFKSNIAKFSLQELIRDMKGIDVELKITQIKKK